MKIICGEINFISLFLSEVQKGKSNDKEIVYKAEEGKLSDGHIIMKDRFDSQGCLDTYSAVEEIPKDDFLPISIVYDI